MPQFQSSNTVDCEIFTTKISKFENIYYDLFEFEDELINQGGRSYAKLKTKFESR